MSTRTGSAASLADTVAAVRQRVLELAQRLVDAGANAREGKLPDPQLAREIDHIVNDASAIAVTARGLLGLENPSAPGSVTELVQLVAEVAKVEATADARAVLDRVARLIITEEADDRILDPVRTRAAQLTAELVAGRAPAHQELARLSLLVRSITQDRGEREDVALEVAEVWGKDLGRAVIKGRVADGPNGGHAEIVQATLASTAPVVVAAAPPRNETPPPPAQAPLSAPNDDANHAHNQRARASGGAGHMTATRSSRAHLSEPEALKDWSSGSLLGSDVDAATAVISMPVAAPPVRTPKARASDQAPPSASDPASKTLLRPGTTSPPGLSQEPARVLREGELPGAAASQHGEVRARAENTPDGPRDADADRRVGARFSSTQPPPASSGDSPGPFAMPPVLAGSQVIAAPEADPLAVRVSRLSTKELAPVQAVDCAPIWRLLRNGDEAGAYWYARCAEIVGARPPVSSQLLSLLQASRWVDRNPNALVGDVAYIAETLDIPDDPHSTMLATAAALVPTLTHPFTRLRDRLQRGLDEALDPVVAAIEEFANFNQPLMPDLLMEETLFTAPTRHVDDARARLEKWLVDGPRRTINFQAATRVWQELFRLDFTPILQRIRDRDPAVLPDAVALAASLRSTKHVNARIQEIDKRLRRSTAAPIIGPAMTRLEREIAETATLLEAWIDVAQKAERFRNMDRLTERAHELRRTLHETLPPAAEWVADLQASQDEAQAACAVALWRSIEHLARLLRLPGIEAKSPVPEGIELLVQGVEGVAPALETRLLWTSTPVGARDPRTPEHAHALLARLASPVPTARQAFDQWIDLASFDEALRLEPLVRPEDVQQAQAALDSARVKLDRKVAELRSSIELGVVDGYVGDERAELLGMLGKIQPRETQNIAAAQRRSDDVQARLDALRSARLEEAWTAWTDLRGQLTKKVDAAVLAPWQERIEAARARGDVRVLDERLAELRDRVGKGQDLSIELERAAGGLRALRQFQDLSERLDRDLERDLVRLRRDPGVAWGEVADKIRRGAPPAPGLEPIPMTHRKRIADVAERWFHLLRNGPRQSHVDLIGGVSVVLRQVGFEPLGTEPFKVVQRHGTAVMMTASLSDGGHSPVPDFGSLAQNRYGVACVWDTNIEAIGRLILSSPDLPTPMLVLYGGRLSAAQRTQLRHVSKQANVKMLCLDDLLLLFLLTEPESSLERFFACTLPYVLLNPYTPFQAGEVAPEMYYGRRQLVDELLGPSGSCIVYGGRQLGKSALLREVRRRFHQPEKQQYAIVLDILTVGDPKAGVETSRIWLQLWDRLRDPKVGIGFETKRSNANALAAALREHLAKHPQMRLTILLDEADNFLDADAKDGFKVVNAFRTLMGETQRRFRVVFTGLHNVQRFQQLPNQPLAHFGAAIQVGPLEPRDAADLVRRPLEALGFEFAEHDDVLRILSYTNYHPGLIQLVCHNLLLQLQQTALQAPPVKVTRQHIDKVYENPAVRKEIVARFDWTLALDQRYQAVAWSLIVDQGHSRLSNRPRTTSELFALVKEWWPQGFAATEFEEFRGLLDEMVGLGVLTASEAGFWLRSPNVVQLMGDVDERLGGLMDKGPPTVFDVDRLHRLAHEDRYSPLRLGQERQLFARRWGVGLVFTSPALDGDGFLPSIGALCDEARFSLREPPTSLPPGELAGWVSSVAGEAAESLLVAVIRASTDPAHTAALIDAACATCARRATGQKLAGRLVFVFDPLATAAWVRSPFAGPTERQVDVVLWPHKWTIEGLRARLHQRELPDDETHVQRLHAITGGWGLLVDRAFRAETGDRGKPEQHNNRLQELDRCLATPGDPNRESFLRSLGIAEDERASRLLELMHTLVGDKTGPRDQLTVGVFEQDMPGLSRDELESLLQLLMRLGVLEPQTGRDGREEVRVDPVVARLMPPR